MPTYRVSEVIDQELADALGAETAELWSIPRGPQAVSIHSEREHGRVIAAVLTTRRPATAAIKIAAVWSDSTDPHSDAALERLVDATVTDARRRGDVAVKWQSSDESELPERCGFSRMRNPYPSAAGTEGVVGYVRWLRSIDHHEPPYYAQTSSFTCGAVTALLAAEIRGSGGFSDPGDNRDQELDFWRRSSNYPTCEPIGLAVAFRQSLPDIAGSAPVEVFLDSDGPVLLEAYPTGFDRSFRVELQTNSLRQANSSDIAVRRERVSIGSIEARLAAGETALLLINIELMTGFDVPHWVLAHAAGDGIVYINDPWISTTWGETWIDAHEVPITSANLDRMLACGADGFRGVIFIQPR